MKNHNSEALDQQKKTKKNQIFGLVVYNIPDRDCSATSAAGKLSFAQGGAQQYEKFIDSESALRINSSEKN